MRLVNLLVSILKIILLYDVLPVDFFDNCNVLGVPKDTDVEACPAASNTDQCVVSFFFQP